MNTDTTTQGAIVEPVTGEREVGSEVCCPVFDPTPFADVTHVWHERLFARTDIRAVMHVPVGMGAAVTRLFRLAQVAQAVPPAEDALLLMHDPSPWKSELLLSVTRDVPGAMMVRLSGTFFSKVFDGPYHDAPKWMAATDAVLAARGEKAQEYYVHYGYCPKCAAKYGHNYAVVFAQVA